MSEIALLARRLQDAREQYLSSVRELTADQGAFKPSPDDWSAAEITEHLVYAEYGGASGMWKALDGIRRGEPVWDGEHIHRGLSIEEVIARTWRPKEDVPTGAGPRLGGPLAFWADVLESCQHFTERLAGELEGMNLESVVFPHPISGPLDARQRFEFLRFHIDRHRDQVERLKQRPDFPPQE